jgi:glycine/D-amino acid oxidase-like deaminating enzyme
MNIVNDNNCGWINNLSTRVNINIINKNQKCDWLIIGAGYTGLSAARKLGQLHPDKKIILVDAQLAGQGASGRNSGYLVDTTLNDGFTSTKELFEYEKKTKIYKLGIETVKNFVKEYQVDCDWNECGKYFASSDIKDNKILENFSKTLNKLGHEHKILLKDDLIHKLGTKFYNLALYTKGGILINPGKLAIAMIKALPENVKLFENSELLNWENNNLKINCKFKNAEVITSNIIFCTNGFLRSLGIKKKYIFPLTLTASLTRKLSNDEYKLIGEPKEWGVLPVKPMGATIRMTNDKRILIRNTAEVSNPNFMKNLDLKKRLKIHEIGIKKRFPEFPNNIIESTWSGVVCRSRNSSQIFDKIDKNIFAAGCYNGSGIGVGTLFGEQIAIKASNQNSLEIDTISNRKKPTWLPPQPFLNIGLRARLFYERIKAINEI